jgi:glyceraldehyde 3-phosphate dehydrogenase
MQPTRLGIMGLGRIGRNLLRLLYRAEDLRIVAVSDIADPEALAYLIKFDTLLGRFPEEVALRDGNLYVAGREIRMLQAEKPGDADWGALGVDVVVEATSRYRTRAELEKHLQAGAQRVVLCAPPVDPPDITVVPGINHEEVRPEHRIVSNGSCTAHAAGPLVKLLREEFGIRRAFLATVHAYTSQQRLADVPTEDKRRGRAAAENIIPQDTNAADMLAELIPALAGRISGKAINVPVPNGSVVDLVCWHERPVSVTAINEAVRNAVASRWRDFYAYEDEPIVSSDILKSPASGTFDSLATMVIGTQLSKTLTWYDNSWGYAHRAIDLVRRLARLGPPAAGAGEGAR